MTKHLLMLCMLLPFSNIAFSQADVEKEFATTMGKKLTADLKTGGDIIIEGWEMEKVSVKVTMGGKDSKDCRVTFDQTPSGIQISSYYAGQHNSHSSHLKFAIHVPKKYDLNLTTMGGGITLTGVEGTCTGKTMGGPLHLSNLKGRLELTTMGGEVILEKSDLSGHVKTMGGELKMRDVTGDIAGSSMGGNVVQEKTGEMVKISSMGGTIEVNDAPAGADVRTMGGPIHVRSASQFVKAKTMGGNVTIDKIDGWVQASTMGGDVNVTMTGDAAKGKRDVTMTSMGGDITLNVPPELSMDFDIELVFTKDADRKYSIQSDFDMKQNVSPEWREDEGSPRKTISGTGTVAGGKNKIKLRTINGDIFVKKTSR